MAEARAPLPTPEDIAWVNSGEVPGNLRFTTSEHYGSRGARQAGGIAGATPLLVNGGASPAFASEGLPGHEQLPNVHAVASPTAEWQSEAFDLPTNSEDLQIRDGKLELRINNDYQRDFETDTEDAFESLAQVDAFITEHAQELSNPDLIEEVDITGLVSANDQRENAGEEGVMELQTPGPDTDGNGISEQDELATERYDKAKTAFVALVQQQFGYDISDKIKPFNPKADINEDRFTDTEVEQVEAFRDQFGYDSVEQMIDYYEGNFGEERDVPPAVAKFLDKTIAREQGALIEIKLKEPKPPVPPIPKDIGRAVMAQMTPGFLPGRFAFDRDRGRRADQFAGKIRGSKVDPRAPGFKRIQPREQNFGRNSQSPAAGQRKGRMARNHGGGRRGKRA